MNDKRPDPKPRKLAHLWQAYQAWDEFQDLRVKHGERLRSIEHGKSPADAEWETRLLDDIFAPAEAMAYKELITTAKTAGPIFDWLIAIKGIGPHTAAKLLALIDDPGAFATISKLWRFAGYAVIDGQREYRKAGEKSHYNSRLKSELYLVTEQFIRHQTPVFVDLYYEEKVKLREKHPIAIGENGRRRYSDMHIHLMAMRKVSKLLLALLWVQWRKLEGLPVSEPYAVAILGHDAAHIMQPEDVVPEWTSETK